jgi:hypothetical protein
MPSVYQRLSGGGAKDDATTHCRAPRQAAAQI